LSQYSPSSYRPAAVVLALAFSVSAAGVASCADHSRPHRIAFASPAHVVEPEVQPIVTASRPAATAPAPAPAARATNGNRVVLVTLDGVRADDVFEGADPSLRP